MDDILKEFLVESYENLDRLDRDLVVLEKDPHSTETLGSIFRTIHTLKGTSGFLGFGKTVEAGVRLQFRWHGTFGAEKQKREFLQARLALDIQQTRPPVRVG